MPRLYFDAAEIPALRDRCRTTHRRYFEALRTWVDAHLHWQPLRGVDETFLRRSSEVYFEETFAFLSNLLLTYLLTEEERYLAAARGWLQVLCSYPVLGSPYSVGPRIAALAHAYDWLDGALPEPERAALRTHLATLVADAVACSASAERAWWHGCYLHHDFWIPTSGYGIGALALLGDVPEAEDWLAHALSEVRHMLAVQGDDGAWHEGAADWVYALVLLFLFADGYRRLRGESLYEHPWLRETWRYRLYCWLPDDTYVYLNDSFRSGRYNIMGSASSHVLRKLAHEYQNPYMQWLADRDEAVDYGPPHPGVFRSPYNWTLNPPYPRARMHCLCWNVLWYDPAVPSRPPDELPAAHLFANQGVLLARSGWDAQATVVSFACAPVGGHAARQAMLAGEPRLLRGATHVHAQASAFTVYSRGRYWIVPPGYGRHASRFQNVVTVNGSGQLWDAEHAGQIVAHALTDELVYALGDASACYPAEYGIRRHLRHFLFLRPDFLILCDILEADAGPARTVRHYAWQVHTDPAVAAVRFEPGRLLLEALDGAGRIIVHLLFPETYADGCAERYAERYGLARSRLLAADGTPLLDQAAVLQNFGVPPRAVYLAVLALTERAQGLPVARLAGQGCVGALLGAGPETRAVLFAEEPGSGALEYSIEPARAARHCIAGLAPGQRYSVSARLEPRPGPRPAHALQPAEEHYVHRLSLRAGEGMTASAAGLLQFAC